MAMYVPTTTLEQVPDHIPTATGGDVMPYLAAVVLWLGGVAVLIVRKIRAA